ncbi:MAG: hypothetical protein HN645_16010 [Gemmatimonadales bacterium]|jgi:hypothetical protein|nr:hypothetical protein [Gemmatimonadales bacterium]
MLRFEVPHALVRNQGRRMAVSARHVLMLSLEAVARERMLEGQRIQPNECEVLPEVIFVTRGAVIFCEGGVKALVNVYA